MGVILTAISIIATFLLTIEGAWILYTTRENKRAKEMMTTPAHGPKKRICIIFPVYRDVVDLDKWLEWSKGEDNITYIIAEDATKNNDKWQGKARVVHRPNRNGFKAGAVNYLFDTLVKEKKEFDYVMLFDSDHIPYNKSVKDIYGYLNKEIMQFFWLDGLPLKSALNWATFSSRYYSNWNIYNRAFPNLTGSAIAIRWDLIKIDHLRFPETITEDYALTLKTIYGRKLKITVMPFVVSIGSSPRDFPVFVKQQLRWAEGTIRDARFYLGSLLSSDTISFSGKIDFLLHVNMYLQGIWTITTFVLFIYTGFHVSFWIVPILLFQAVSYLKTLSKAPAKYLSYYFLLNYYMAFVQIWAFLRAFLVKRGSFYVTEKT